MELPGLASEIEEPPAVTWGDVYHARRDGLVRLAYLLTGSQAVAEDLVQDTFIRVMAHIGPEAAPERYLRRSVVNACHDWHRRSWREVGPIALEPEAAAVAEGDDTGLWAALGQLDPQKRTVLVLRFYLDLAEADVAATLGLPVGTVKSTTHRALADLRRMVQR